MREKSNIDTFDEITSELFEEFGYSIEEIIYDKHYRIIPPNGRNLKGLMGSGDFTVEIENDSDIDRLEELLNNERSKAWKE